MERLVGSARNIQKKCFSHLTSTDLEIWTENLFLLFNIQEIEKKFFWSAFPCEQTNPFAYSRSFTLYTT